MGFLLAITLLAIWLSGRRSATHLAVPVAAFLAPLLLAVGWFMANPSAYPDTFGRWVIHAAHLVSPLDGARAFVNWNTLGTRVSLYWGFFDPSWLFFDAASPAASPLRGASPFLFATMIGLVAGVSQRVYACHAAPAGRTGRRSTRGLNLRRGARHWRGPCRRALRDGRGRGWPGELAGARGWVDSDAGAGPTGGPSGRRLLVCRFLLALTLLEDFKHDRTVWFRSRGHAPPFRLRADRCTDPVATRAHK